MAASILIVDDNRDLTDSLGLLFEAAGHEVRRTYSPMEAEQAVHDGFRPSVVFVDIVLPQADGLTLARRLSELLPCRPVLVTMTGFPDHHERAMKAGFDFHFLKPVQPADLLRLVEMIG